MSRLIRTGNTGSRNRLGEFVNNRLPILFTALLLVFASACEINK